jgi:hypothetical protein
MIRKVSILWLVSLFAWNALFGAFGGLLLCIHEGELHFESVTETAVTCVDNCVESSVHEYSVSEPETCIDIELSKLLIVSPRVESGQSLAVAPIILDTWTGSLLRENTLRTKAESRLEPMRAPPVGMSASVLVARVHYLRV